LNPEYIYVYGSIGRAYLKAGSYEMAIENLNKAIQLDPSNGYDYYSLGLAYRKMNNGDKVNEILGKLKDMKSVYYDQLRLRISGADID
jgi:tetratricopeptide (TPR) repeat protein